MARSALVRALDDDGVVLPLLVCPGALGAMLLGPAAPGDPWWAPPVLLVGCSVAARGCSHRTTAGALGLLWGLFTDGFVLHRLGRLTPPGPDDLLWLGAFLGVALLVGLRPTRRTGRRPTRPPRGAGRGHEVVEEIGNGAGGVRRCGHGRPTRPTPTPPAPPVTDPPPRPDVRLGPVVPVLDPRRRN